MLQFFHITTTTSDARKLITINFMLKHGQNVSGLLGVQSEATSFSENHASHHIVNKALKWADCISMVKEQTEHLSNYHK